MEPQLQDMSTRDRAELTKEYLRRLRELESQEQTLRMDKKDLREEFKNYIDLKALHKALRIQKIQSSLKTQEEEMAFANALDALKLKLERASQSREQQVLSLIDPDA